MAFKLRTRILMFLFSFAILPLTAAVVINLPLVLDRVQLFFQRAIVQDMRSDFTDLDTHLASRDEMVRLLAKLPDPGMVMGVHLNSTAQQIDQARVSYTKWINRIFSDQIDVLDILFLDQAGVSKFWLSRDLNTQEWLPTINQPQRPPNNSINAILQSNIPGVLSTSVLVDVQAKDIFHAITLQLLSPLGPADGLETYGAVAVTLDIGGLVRRDANTMWVHDDGSYLAIPGMMGMPDSEQSAFDDFAGLDRLFATGKMSLWDGKNDQNTIWLPLLKTSDDRPLWVGRRIENEPLLTLMRTLSLRVMSIILVLVIATLFMARWAAAKMEHYGSDLFSGIHRMLAKGEAVNFDWHGSPELQQLGRNLSDLAQTHASNVRNLRAHARELEASYRFQTEFLANVSHELRTPLNSILLLSKILNDNPKNCSDEQRQQLSVIHDASKDLRGLIDNVLDLSRIESGGLQPVIESVDLPQLMQDMHSLMQPQFDEKGVPLLLYIADDARHVVDTDADKVRQILKNFLSNAVKFTQSGTVQLQLLKAEAPYAAAIAVKDTGIGIPKEKQHVIFEAFKQADGSTRRKFGGTGLGLSISCKLAEMIGAALTVDSAPDEGAVFSVLLPTKAQAAATTDGVADLPLSLTEASITERDTPLRANLDGCKILIVEQDIDSLLHLSLLLESWEIEVLAAGDEEEFLEALTDEPDLDILLISSAVPGLSKMGLDGWQQSAHLEKIIALLYDNNPVLQDSAEVSLQMPFDPAALLAAIKRIQGD